MNKRVVVLAGLVGLGFYQFHGLCGFSMAQQLRARLDMHAFTNAERGTARRIQSLEQHLRAHHRHIQTLNNGSREELHRQMIDAELQELGEQLSAAGHPPGERNSYLLQRHRQLAEDHGACLNLQESQLARLHEEVERAAGIDLARQAVNNAGEASARDIEDRLHAHWGGVGVLLLESIVLDLEGRQRRLESEQGLRQSAGYHFPCDLFGGEDEERAIDGTYRGSLFRLIPGREQTSGKVLNEESGIMPHLLPAPSTRNDHGLISYGFGSCNYTLPRTPITRQEAMYAASQLQSPMWNQASAYVLGARTAIGQPHVQEYFAGLINEAMTTRADEMHKVLPIVQHARTYHKWMGFVVRPEGGVCLGPEEATAFLNGNGVGGHAATYPCTYALGLNGYQQSLNEMGAPGGGNSRLYLVMRDPFITEACTINPYIINGCTLKMAIGISFTGPYLSRVQPLVLTLQAEGGSLGPWKRAMDGEKDCFAPMLFSTICGVAARGWVRMNIGGGNGFWVQQGFGLVLSLTPGWERRIEVATHVLEGIMAQAAGIMANAGLGNPAASSRALNGIGLAVGAHTLALEAITRACTLQHLFSQAGLGSPLRTRLLARFYRTATVLWRAMRVLKASQELVRSAA